MLIRCIRCKTEFEQQKNERTCGCPTPSSLKVYESTRIAARLWDKEHRDRLYLIFLERYFQNPIYQWVREFITTENFTHYSTFKKQAKNF